MSRRDNVSAGVFDFSNAVGFEVFDDQTNTSTTSVFPNYITKLSGTTTEIGSGRYIINWSFEVANSSNNNSTWSRLQWKTTSSPTYLTLSEIDNFVGRSNKYVPVSGFKVVDVLIDDTIDFKIDFASGGATARIQNVNIYIFRVAT